MSVAAVVVSFNRLSLLKKCLAALEHQSHRLDEVIVVDNGSSDGSSNFVREAYPNFTLFETGKNLGGAGGFAWGLELAMAKGHDFAWIMDDDAEPMPDSLAPLMAVMDGAGSAAPSFAWSLIEDFDGELNPGHLPKISKDPASQLAASGLGAIAVEQATFVGLLINLKVARETALPYEDFFIWFDDAEYTSRLSKRQFGVLVPQSVVMHPVAAAGSPDMGRRLFYYVRNGLWTTRLRPIRGTILDTLPVQVLATLMTCLRQLPHAADKRLWVSSVGRGLWQGLTRLPSRKMPGEKLAARPA